MIELDIQKQFPGSKDFQISIREIIKTGEFVVIHGPSGSGKTSILRMIAGFLKPDSGSVKVAGEIWYSGTTNYHLAIQKRNIGFVFQDYALFPNMTVHKNLVFASHVPDDPLIMQLVERTGLMDMIDKKPNDLSGGQKQRVALIRAIVQRPQILLLDEPFSAVDAALRIQLKDLVIEMHQQLGLTTLLISHDNRKIIQYADRDIRIVNGQKSNEMTQEVGEIGIVDKILDDRLIVTVAGRTYEFPKSELPYKVGDQVDIHVTPRSNTDPAAVSPHSKGTANPSREE